MILTYEDVFDGGRSIGEERLVKDCGWSTGNKITC